MNQATNQGSLEGQQQNINDILDSISLALESIKRKSKVSSHLNPVSCDSSSETQSHFQIASQPPHVSQPKRVLVPPTKRTQSVNLKVPGIHSCCLCPAAIFPDQLLLARHTALVHKQSSSFNFNPAIILPQGKFQGDPIPISLNTYKCAICGKMISKANRALHENIHYRERQLCPHCFQNFWFKQDLKKHLLRFHNGVEPGHYHCKDCNKTFDSPSAHKTHYEQHTIAIQKLNSKRNRENPYPMLKPVKELEHKKNGESIAAVVEQLPKVAKRCPVCPSVFYRQPDLLAHVNTDHKSLKSVLYVCDICGVIFLGLTMIVGHLKEAHGKSDYCTDCNRSFSTEEDNRLHFREKGVCGICNARFVNRCLLNQHLKLHLTWRR